MTAWIVRRAPKGYTCMAALERSSGLCLAAGTAGGLVEVLDVATASQTASMLATADLEVSSTLRRHSVGFVSLETVGDLLHQASKASPAS